MRNSSALRLVWPGRVKYAVIHCVTSTHERTERGGSFWPVWLAVALATVEALAVSYAVDAQSVYARGGLWRLLGSAGFVLTWLASVLAMGALLWVLRGEQVGMPRPDGRPRLPILGLHGVCYAGFYGLSWRIFGPVGLPGAWDAWQLAAWLVLAVATVASLLRVAVTGRWLLQVLGEHWRLAGFAVLMGSVAWSAGQLSQLAWTPLAPVTLRLVVSLLHTLEPEVLYHESTALVGTPRFRVTVAPVCSGIEGVGLMLVFMGVLLWVGRDRFLLRRAWVLVPLSAVAVWVANLLRITLLIEVGDRLSPTVAMGGFHSKAGWLFFCGVAFVFAALAQRSQYLTGGNVAERHPDEWNPTVTYLTPLMVLLGVSMVTLLFSTGGLDHLYGIRVVAVAVALALVARRLPRPRVALGWHALLTGTVVFVVWIVLTPASEAADLAAARAELATLSPTLRWGWILLRVAGAVVTVPIAEELAFRGFLLPRLIDENFIDVSPRRLTLLSLVVSSLAFGLLHQSWVAGTVAGVAYAWARQHRGRLGDAIVAHALTNALISADVLLRGSWYLWL